MDNFEVTKSAILFFTFKIMLLATGQFVILVISFGFIPSAVMVLAADKQLFVKSPSLFVYLISGISALNLSYLFWVVLRVRRMCEAANRRYQLGVPDWQISSPFLNLGAVYRRMLRSSL